MGPRVHSDELGDAISAAKHRPPCSVPLASSFVEVIVGEAILARV